MHLMAQPSSTRTLRNMKRILICGALLISSCELRDWGLGDGGPVDAASPYDASAGVGFDGPLVLDDERVQNLDPTLLPAGDQPCRQPVLVRVYRALDGDTFLADEAVENGQQLDVRLIGINSPEIMHAPEPAQCYGDDAHTFTRQLENHYVYLTFASHCTDEYDRTLAYVHIGPGETDFYQRQLLRRGFARTYFAQDNPRYASLFMDDQAAADSANIGLWGACQ